ncbi:hypothetical protein [Skermania sp. ID1734]|nr:hypothetical protein [Skermania sp. ID1734]
MITDYGHDELIIVHVPLALVVFGVTLSLSSYAITVLRGATHER